MLPFAMEGWCMLYYNTGQKTHGTPLINYCMVQIARILVVCELAAIIWLKFFRRAFKKWLKTLKKKEIIEEKVKNINRNREVVYDMTNFSFSMQCFKSFTGAKRYFC